VVGRTDYIYGSGIVFFQSCEIRSWGGGWITAPSTARNQSYGFVFNECDITYELNSPRGGDDGELVRLGRPWNNYPKVAWLHCQMTEMINPQGWGDKWNMDYADTSPELHLYEYQNTGPGADMSQRANWVGIKELTDEEALDYTVQKVLGGNDDWDPTSEAPLVQTYSWTGNGDTDGWKVAENWDPVGVPANGEAAEVDSVYTLVAEGDTFAADLSIKNGATLQITATSTVNYLSVAAGEIQATSDAALYGKISTKDSVVFSEDYILELNAILSGVHDLVKTGSGRVVLNGDNSNFSGQIKVNEGSLEAASGNSLGKSSVQISNGATLIIGNDNAFYAKSKLEVESGASLVLNADVTISEFFIDGEMQGIGEYTASTNPELISGEGKIIIGRPETFTFHRGSNGNWDVPENFIPALIPEAGETVIVEEEMETTSTIFAADIVLQNGGNLRLRGDHTATGTIHMKEGTSFRYNTNTSGMTLNAPVSVEGDVTMIMESGNSAGSTMTLGGPISGSSRITALNNGKATVNNGTLLLTGNNSDFTGTWDLTQYSNKYPATPGYITLLEGESENAFGKSKIITGLENRVVFSNSKATGDTLDLSLNESAKAVLNVDIALKSFVLNGSQVETGEYSALTNPELYEGEGKITVGETDTIPVIKELLAFPGAEGNGKYVTGGRGGQVIYVTNLEDNNSPGSLRYALNQSGPRIILFKISGTIQLKSKLNITKGDVTLAGQTAPGDGITLRDYTVYVEANNVIIRFMRFRMGDETAQEDDALGGRRYKNIIVDHCSMSWSTDECVSFYDNELFTLQWSIISESLRNSVHEKGTHGYGGIWGGKGVSYHHNLLSCHDSRNPRFCGSRYSNKPNEELIDYRNNVIYNWGGNSAYGGEGGRYNMVNNYYKAGPATSSSKQGRIIEPYADDGKNQQPAGTYGKFYIDENYMTKSASVTNDNWLGVNLHSSFATYAPGVTKDDIKSDTEFPFAPVTMHTAEKAYEKILDYCGASLSRDSVDLRIIHDVTTGTVTYTDGGNGSKNGLIDTQSAVGGWPVLESLAAPADSDDDGMPNAWEIANNLNPYDPGDAQLKSVDGVYPNVEVYINSLVADIVEAQNEGGIPTKVNDIPLNKPAEENIKIYFNNAEHKLVVSHSDRIKNVRIYSITGQILINQEFDQQELNIDTSFLNRGIYIVLVQDVQNRVFSKKLVSF